VIPASLLVVFSWFSQGRSIPDQTVTLVKASLVVSSKDGSATLPWTTFTRYKETPWSFLVWRIRPATWLMLPKSVFPSLRAIEDCRELLARHLKRSTWFFG
jgi:hypothetical protein